MIPSQRTGSLAQAIRQWLVRVKALVFALWHAVRPVKKSYSQAGEDAIVWAAAADDDALKGVYVDVGANHPSRLSNTYLFYRRGFKGIVVEPTERLLQLHRLIRPDDIQIRTACGDVNTVLPFVHAASHVLSGLATGRLKSSPITSKEYMPVLRLDDIAPVITSEPILLLSIDVEGYDFQVLQGASNTLKRTRFVIVEGSAKDCELVQLMQAHGFEILAASAHNMIFRRPACTDRLPAASAEG